MRSTATRTVTAVLVWLALAMPGAAKPLVGTPVYNPETKSYFELVRAPVGLSIRGSELAEIGWARARKYAASRIFKGVRGRLAVVKTKRVSDFLRDTFKPEREVWIGLRFFCRTRTLMWVTAEIHPPSAYKNWARPWKLGWACSGGTKYAPVYYTPAKKGFRWQARGQRKEYYFLFVEYPTGKE